jgi:DNA-binding response OmpR family regulator
VVPAVDGEQALASIRSGEFDLVLLDVMLPGMSGTEVLRVMRSEGLRTPVIIVSARGDEMDRVVGLKVGADDYVTKPFSRPELLARVEAVLRRGAPAARAGRAGEVTRTSVGHLLIDPDRRLVSLAGSPVDVTPREFELLAYLAREPGRIFTREQLLVGVWGDDFEGDDRTIDVHVSWLRRKLRGNDGHDWFRAVRGVGYALSPPDA